MEVKQQYIYWGNTTQRYENIECWINFWLLWNNNSTDTQEMDNIVRYWSCIRKKVVVLHLLWSCIHSNCCWQNLRSSRWEKTALNILLGVSYDGPEVNKFIDIKLSKVLSNAELPVLIDIGSYTLLMVHNIYLKVERCRRPCIKTLV